MARRLRVAEVKEVPEGTALAVDIEGHSIALFNIGGAFYAIDNSCTHAGGSLAEGDLDGSVVNCPLHGARFDVTSGEVVGPPAAADLGRYAVHVEGGGIKIDASDLSES